MNARTSPFTTDARPNLGDEEIESLYRMAHQLYSSGMRTKAHEVFAFIAAYKPRSIRFNKALGISFMSNGEYEAAIPVLATAMLCDPDSDPALYVACAECLALTERHQQAGRLFKKAKVLLQNQQDCLETQRLDAHADGWLTILKYR
jgi:Flp pilus assembly protein TadD